MLTRRLVCHIIYLAFRVAHKSNRHLLRGHRIRRGVAQLGRAPGLGPGGRRFESCHLDLAPVILRSPGFYCFSQSKPYFSSCCSFICWCIFSFTMYIRRSASTTRGLISSPFPRPYRIPMATLTPSFTNAFCSLSQNR